MTILNFILIIAGWLILIFLLASICKTLYPIKKELPRKIIHIGTGPIIALACWFDIPKNLVLPIASIITIGLFINYQFRFIKAIEDIQRKSFGTILYGSSITLLILLFWPKYCIAITSGILVMAFGDGLAGLIGKELTSKRWKILGQEKSIAGTSTMCVITISILSLIALITNISISPIEIIAIGLIATGLEQISIWGIDNLTVPISVTLAWISISSI